MEKPVANGKHWHNDELRNFEQNLQKMSFHQSKDGAKKEQDVHSFPEGGWGWVVCLASFWTNGIIFGVMNCYGVIFVKLKDQFEATHSDDAAFLTSWVGSVSIGMTFLLSPVASILIDKIGIRRTAFLGGFLASLGMFLSSLIKNLELLYLTYGVVLGSGASLAYTPSLVILGHYFKQRLGLVNGLVTAGSSVFTTIVPLLLKYLLDVVGLMTTMQGPHGLSSRHFIWACWHFLGSIGHSSPDCVWIETLHPAAKKDHSRTEFFSGIVQVLERSVHVRTRELGVISPAFSRETSHSS